MELRSLTVSGLFTYREPVTLDLAALPPGLIAVMGETGAGKTALAELAIGALYRELPTRAKPLADYATARDAFVEATYDTAAGPRRARVNLDGERRLTQAVLMGPNGSAGGWTPLTDGKKLAEFDAAIAGVFPPFDVLLATAFAAQTRRGSFAALDQTGRKALFQSLLGHAHYQRWAETCTTIARAIDRRLDTLAPWLADLERRGGPAAVAAAVDVVTMAAAALADAEGTLADRTVARDEADRAVAAARATAAAHEGRRRERNGVAMQRTAADVRHRDAVSAVAAHVATDPIAAINRTLDAVTAGKRREIDACAIEPVIAARDRVIAAATADAVAQTAAIDARVAGVREVLDDAATIREAAATLAREETALADRRAALDVHRADVRALTATIVALDRGLAPRADLPGRLAHAREAVAGIAALPFGDKCVDSGCAFVAAATRARAALPALETDAAQYQTDVADRATAADQRDARAARLDEAEAGYAGALRTLTASAPAVRARVARLDAAETRLAELTGDRAAVDGRRDEAIRAAGIQCSVTLDERAVRVTDLDREIAALAAQAAVDRAAAALAWETERDRRRAALDAVTADLDRLTGALADLDAALATAAADEAAALDAHEAALRADAAWRDGFNARATLAARHDAARVARDAVTRDAGRLDVLAADVAALRAEGADWRFLADTFGPDGLPLLEIDAAGPAVSALANDLLARALGADRFTVEIVTQDAKAKGGLRDSFELKVWDSEAGAVKARDVRDLSGGQQILVDEAIKCALLLYVNAHTRSRILTVWRDETTSALYPATAVRYVDMLRHVVALGGFRHLVFITHQPAAAALADAQIHVADGTITIHRPPYEAGA